MADLNFNNNILFSATLLLQLEVLFFLVLKNFIFYFNSLRLHEITSKDVSTNSVFNSHIILFFYFLIFLTTKYLDTATVSLFNIL